METYDGHFSTIQSIEYLESILEHLSEEEPMIEHIVEDSPHVTIAENIEYLRYFEVCFNADIFSRNPSRETH